MAEDQKDRYIQYLAEQHQEDLLTQKAMQLVLEDFMARQKELDERMAAVMSEQAELKKELAEERQLRKSLERKAESLKEKLDYANHERFGDRRQKVRKKTGSGTPEKTEPDRRKEKDDFDGTEDTLCMDSVDDNRSGSVPENAGKERDLTNHLDKYKTMGVTSEPVFHPSDLSKIPGRIIEKRSVPVFSLKTVQVEERFEMVHYVEPGRKPKWGYFPSEGHPGLFPVLKGRRPLRSSCRPSLMRFM